jgi:hypothetical protein
MLVPLLYLRTVYFLCPIRTKVRVSNLVDLNSSFLLHSQVKFSSMLHKKIPAEAGIGVVCASPGIVDTNVVSSVSISFVCCFRRWVIIYKMYAYPTFASQEI